MNLIEQTGLIGRFSEEESVIADLDPLICLEAKVNIRTHRVDRDCLAGHTQNCNNNGGILRDHFKGGSDFVAGLVDLNTIELIFETLVSGCRNRLAGAIRLPPGAVLALIVPVLTAGSLAYIVTQQSGGGAGAGAGAGWVLAKVNLPMGLVTTDGGYLRLDCR